MDPVSLRVTQNAYLSLLTHAKQLLLVTFCDLTAGILKRDGLTWTPPKGRTDVKVEIVI